MVSGPIPPDDSYVPVAQQIEHHATNVRVAGAIPARDTDSLPPQPDGQATVF